MKGLENIPSLAELEKTYVQLQSGSPFSEAEYVLTSQWTRFDPRLAEIWITRFVKDWPTLHLPRLRDEIQKQPWPAAFGVLIEQALAYREIPKREYRTFRQVMRALMQDVDPAPYENYFIGLAPLGGKSLQRDAEAPLRCFLRWGYFGREVFTNKARQREWGRASTSTQLVPEVRARLLDELLSEKPRITVADYLKKLEHQVPERTAQLDLKNHSELRAVGQTRGRFYTRRSLRK